jgi:hypothetical protein
LATFRVRIMKKVKTIRILRSNVYPVYEAEEPTAMYLDDESDQSDLDGGDQWQQPAEDEQPDAVCTDDASDLDGVDQWQPPGEDEQPATTYPDDPSDGISDTGNPPLQPAAGNRVRPADLLLKEVDEIYDWARLGCQLCFALCTLFLAINAVAIGWLTTSNRPFVFFLFIVFNVVGALTTIFLGKYLLQCDQRVREVIWLLTQHRETDDPWSWPRSAVPRTAIKILFSFTAFALIVLVVVWTGLFVAAL